MSPEADRIIAEFRRCKSVNEVNHVSRKYGETVAEMEASPTLYVRAIHIKNAARYMRLMIEKDTEST